MEKKKTYEKPKMTRIRIFCKLCNGTGQMKADGIEGPCPRCKGTGEIQASQILKEIKKRAKDIHNAPNN